MDHNLDILAACAHVNKLESEKKGHFSFSDILEYKYKNGVLLQWHVDLYFDILPWWEPDTILVKSQNRPTETLQSRLHHCDITNPDILIVI